VNPQWHHVENVASMNGSRSITPLRQSGARCSRTSRRPDHSIKRTHNCIGDMGDLKDQGSSCHVGRRTQECALLAWERPCSRSGTNITDRSRLLSLCRCPVPVVLPSAGSLDHDAQGPDQRPAFALAPCPVHLVPSPMTATT